MKTDTNSITKLSCQDIYQASEKSFVALSNGIPNKLPCQDTCQAPLCPFDCHDLAVWYPDDEICNTKAISKPAWVSTQRKIQRLYRQGLIDSGECFTRPMLEGLKRIVKGLHGMKPENLHKDSTGQAA